MTKEVLKLALEALEASDWYIDQLEMIVYCVDDEGTHENRAKVQAAITAIKEALARPQQEPDKYLYRVDVSRREDNTCTEYDHPIYFHSNADANNYCWTINQAPYPRNTIVVAKCVDIKIAPPPAQRTWVNLPDEEIKILWIQYRAAFPRYLCFAKTLLARAKEKNT